MVSLLSTRPSVAGLSMVCPHEAKVCIRMLSIKLCATISAHMTRSELITKLASRFPQLTQVDADLSVKTILDAISIRLAQGGRVEIRGFGSFSVHSRPPRLGRNPKTGERVPVPEKFVPHFKPGIELRERVNIEPEKRREKIAA